MPKKCVQNFHRKNVHFIVFSLSLYKYIYIYIFIPYRDWHLHFRFVQQNSVDLCGYTDFLSAPPVPNHCQKNITKREKNGWFKGMVVEHNWGKLSLNHPVFCVTKMMDCTSILGIFFDLADCRWLCLQCLLNQRCVQHARRENERTKKKRNNPEIASCWRLNKKTPKLLHFVCQKKTVRERKIRETETKRSRRFVLFT